MYIGISGNLGSGKSTLARELARKFNCDVYPNQSYNTSYVEDLFRQPERWTTEAQISFMVHKHDAIRRGMEHGRLFILDRTFEEDVQVFAERFHDDGVIDVRSMELIRQLASYLQASLEPPSLIVYCDCPIDVCEARLRERPRSYQRQYPPDHLSKLNQKLQSWIERQSEIPVIRTPTNLIDYRERQNAATLALEIDARLRTTMDNQLDFFEQNVNTRALASLLRPKQIYLAAPFTSQATKRKTSSGERAQLFSTEYIESIPAGYRTQLLALANAFEKHGYGVLLPHRDINRWGRRALPASEIASQCLRAINTCDFFVGLIAESFGSHVELGYALGLGKPSLVLVSESNPMSFFGGGMATMDGVACLRAKSVSKLASMIKTNDPLSLISTKMRYQPCSR